MRAPSSGPQPSPPVTIRPSSLGLGSLLLAMLQASPLLALGGFIAFIGWADDQRSGSGLAIAMGVGCVGLGLRGLWRSVSLRLSLSLRGGRLYLAQRLCLSSAPPSSVLVKFDAHGTWNTYLVSGRSRTLFARSTLDPAAKARIQTLAHTLSLPIYQQDLLAKPVRARWKTRAAKRPDGDT
jgi:hypothetical protein